MKKLCGHKESCFENGSAVWGHVGNTLCLHASEVKREPRNVGVCGKTGEEVLGYIAEWQYKEIFNQEH